jgi:signal transduction histidine kinase
VEERLRTPRRKWIPALLFTGFQESSHWREETERYRALAEVAQQVCIFAGAPLPPESSERQLHVTLVGDDPLRQEWFVVLLCPQFCALLCGQDRQEPASPEALCQFDTLWSFSPAVVGQVLDLLEQVVGQYCPERLAPLREARGRLPPVPPDPELITRFTVELIRFEEQLHRQLQATTDTLASQLQWRNDMLALLSHDMRTPLQSISTSVDLLRHEELLAPGERGEMLALIRRGVRQLSDLTQLVLDVHALEAGRLAVQWHALPPQPLIEEALDPLGVLVSRAQIVLRRRIDPELGVLWGDPLLLRRVIQNLVANALKFTPGGGEILVSAGFSARRDMIELRVRDSGSGMAPQVLQQVFERHYQADEHDRRGAAWGCTSVGSWRRPTAGPSAQTASSAAAPASRSACRCGRSWQSDSPCNRLVRLIC